MSRKTNRILAKKQRRKLQRKIKKTAKKMDQAIKFSKCSSVVSHTMISGHQPEPSEFQAVEGPSTSKNCGKQLSPQNNLKRSPWRNAGGKLKKFKKITDRKKRKAARRKVYIAQDNQTQIKIKPNKSSSFKKTRTHRRKTRNMCKDNNSRDDMSLEEGEIRSETNAETSFNQSYENNSEDDDDCIVVEAAVDEITIDEGNDNDDVSTGYQSLINSFTQRVSSTPYHHRHSDPSHASNAINSHNISADTNLPFFIDVGLRSGIESINSTDTFIDYTKLSTLTESSQQRRRKVLLKENVSNEIIDLDDTANGDNRDHTTLKPASEDFDDESVIFVSETNKNDFISIVDDTIPPHKILKTSDVLPITPASKKSTNKLFTKSESKQLHNYNENAYNPSSNESFTIGRRMVIIDGSNVAFKHGLDQAFSVKGLKIAIDYFKKMGHEVKAVIPQFRMNKTKSTDPEELERLHKMGAIVQTPCKNLPGLTSTSYDDRFILQLAFELDAAIVSNDNYRDLLHENPAFKKIIENRVIGYTWCNDIFILPKDPYGKWGPNLHNILNRS